MEAKAAARRISVLQGHCDSLPLPQVANVNATGTCTAHEGSASAQTCPYVQQQQQQQQSSAQSNGLICPARPPLKVLITGAGGQIGYALAFRIASGAAFGPHHTMIINLFDLPVVKQSLEGVKLELEDCAFPLIAGINVTTDIKEAFTGVDVAILVGSFPRKDGMERKDLLKANGAIFREQGKALNDYASRDVKVLVVGNPANTNALIAMTCAPDLPRENFTALTRLDHNRAKHQIAQQLNVPSRQVHNVIIWGNHSSTQYPSVGTGYVSDMLGQGLHTSVQTAVNNEEWTRKTFIPAVQQRGAAIIKARKLSSAASAANAIVDHLHDWLIGTPAGEMVSMAVHSDGSYGIEKGLIYSFPVTAKNGKYTIVQGVPIDAFSREKLTATETELKQEKADAFAGLGL